jgi:Domain of unknown function (DUF6471)
MKPDSWTAQVKRTLKAELKMRKISYSDLADKLAAIGVEEHEKNIANKISRGAFKAVFLFQCLEAIGCDSLRLATSQTAARRSGSDLERYSIRLVRYGT